MNAALVKLIKTLPVGGEWTELEAIVRIICQGIGLIGAAKAKEAINQALHIEVERWAEGSLKLLDQALSSEDWEVLE